MKPKDIQRYSKARLVQVRYTTARPPHDCHIINGHIKNISADHVIFEIPDKGEVPIRHVDIKAIMQLIK